MTKRMLIDATHTEETRVAIVSGNKLDEYDYENVLRKQLKSNIYLVKVTRVEPSLQAAFVDFGGNRHGFLPFPEIHPDYYRIPIADREALIAEERAIAAAQAAKEDEEDEAELAAQGESLDDLDDEDEDEDEDDAPEADSSNVEVVSALPEDDEEEDEDEIEAKAEAVMAADNVAERVSDDSDADEEENDDDAEENDDDAEAETAADGTDEDEEEEEDDDNEEAPRRGKPSLESIGGDTVETPVFRSSIKRNYKIQEVIKRNQIMLIQISKEERGNKGAAVTSYISLPGRYCVLMPNSPRGGGVSRKVSNAKDRQRLKKILAELNVPDGMSVILRTAGVSRSKAEIKRDLDYLLRLWDQIRELTLKSTAPALIYEEGNLIKRAIRDLYRRDIDEVHVAGEEGYKNARDFMKTLMPSHADRVKQYTDTTPLFHRHQVEKQIDAIHEPTVHLKSGGYIVINPTEALVSIDVNSGKATKGRHIEETALKTNIEAAEEIARQLRLRDQGGLIVIDFIDMEDRRSNRIVEKKLRDAMAGDRARIQLGRISPFGLLELSRQRLHPSLVETNFEVCTHCEGIGVVRTVETTAVMVLRAIEEEGLKGRATEIRVNLPAEVALYIMNNKRQMLGEIEKRCGLRVVMNADATLHKPHFSIDVLRGTGSSYKEPRQHRHAPVQTVDMSDLPELTDDEITDDSTIADDESRERGGDESRDRGEDDGDTRERGGNSRRNRDDDRRGRRGGRNRNRGGRNRGRDRNDQGHGNGNGDGGNDIQPSDEGLAAMAGNEAPAEGNGERQDQNRRRRRRGGRNRNRGGRDRNTGESNGNNAGGDVGYSQPEARPVARAVNEAPMAHAGPAQDESSSDADGKARKGWWKRLTE